MNILIVYEVKCVDIGQILSIRDISRSQVDDAVGNSGNRRLLRLKLTDGHSEITAIEYPHVPSISDDVSPGTKVPTLVTF